MAWGRAHLAEVVPSSRPFPPGCLFCEHTVRRFEEGDLSRVFSNAEWTQISTRYLREQLAKISDFYHLASGAGDGPVPVPPDVEHALKQWGYNAKLAFHMLQVTPRGRTPSPERALPSRVLGLHGLVVIQHLPRQRSDAALGSGVLLGPEGTAAARSDLHR